MRKLTAKIHSFESFATLDGPGTRFAIFFQGCPYRCAYCHNPDTQVFAGGTEYTVDEIVAKAVRFKPYFRHGGGVTLSGGEPLAQAEFIAALEAKLKEHDISCAIDTSGAMPLGSIVRAALDGCDMLILDIKMPDEDRYRKYIGGGLDTVLATLDYAIARGKRIWLRTVIVPDINDSETAIDEYIDLLGDRLKSVEKYELLAFHTLGFDKYVKAGIANPLENTAALDKDALSRLQSYLDTAIKDIIA
ncbi:MAG: radical SAM protein [Clostridia bacterium]|nr:radical SAM protein [Clostridia bacterium]